MGRHCICAQCDRGDTRDGCDLLPDLLYVRGARFARLNTAPLVSVLHVHHDPELHDIRRSIAKRYLFELKKAADGRTRRGHEKKRDRDLRGDKNAPALFCGSTDNANPPAWKHTCRIVTRETPCGDKTEEDPAEQR